jgi:hypothetical protein
MVFSVRMKTNRPEPLCREFRLFRNEHSFAGHPTTYEVINGKAPQAKLASKLEVVSEGNDPNSWASPQLKKIVTDIQSV